MVFSWIIIGMLLVALSLTAYFLGKNVQERKVKQYENQAAKDSAAAMAYLFFGICDLVFFLFLCGVLVASSVNYYHFGYGDGKKDFTGTYLGEDALKPGDYIFTAGEPQWCMTDHAGEENATNYYVAHIIVNRDANVRAFKLPYKPPKEGKVVELVNNNDGKKYKVIVSLNSEFANLGEPEKKPESAEKNPNKQDKPE